MPLASEHSVHLPLGTRTSPHNRLLELQNQCTCQMPSARKCHVRPAWRRKFSYWYYSDYIVSVRPSNNRRQRALAARSPFHASHTRTHNNHKHITNGSKHYVQNEYVTHIPTSLCRNVPDGRAQTDRSSTFPCAQTDRSNTCKTNVVRVLTWRSLFECSTRHPDESVHALIYKAEPDLKSNRTSTTNIKIATPNPHHFDYHFPPL
jgi:hypothetical protein